MPFFVKPAQGDCPLTGWWGTRNTYDLQPHEDGHLAGQDGTSFDGFTLYNSNPYSVATYVKVYGLA